jgi:hypothetical protein
VLVSTSSREGGQEGRRKKGGKEKEGGKENKDEPASDHSPPIVSPNVFVEMFMFSAQ